MSLGGRQNGASSVGAFRSTAWNAGCDLEQILEPNSAIEHYRTHTIR